MFGYLLSIVPFWIVDCSTIQRFDFDQLKILQISLRISDSDMRKILVRSDFHIRREIPTFGSGMMETLVVGASLEIAPH